MGLKAGLSRFKEYKMVADQGDRDPAAGARLPRHGGTPHSAPDAGYPLLLQHRPLHRGAAGGRLYPPALEFAAFPTVLLIATLLRLALNVASTRVVLLEGHNGSAAAGHVIGRSATW